MDPFDCYTLRYKKRGGSHIQIWDKIKEGFQKKLAKEHGWGFGRYTIISRKFIKNIPAEILLEV